MPCKITTTWCQTEERCSAKVVKDGNPFIDPPVSSLFPSNGDVYYYDPNTCVLGGGPGGGRLPTTVNWEFSDGQWRWNYTCNGQTITQKTYSATKVQNTKIERICQDWVVCYQSQGECPGGSPPGTPAPGTFNDYANWSNAVQSQADALGATTTSTLPTLPITLSSESTTSVSNSGTGSTTPQSTTSSGASADCLSFNNPTETVSYPSSGPTTDSSTGPSLTANN
jgi:hypothetical protein